MGANNRRLLCRLVAVASAAAALSLVVLNVELLEGSGFDVLDQVTKMNGYVPNGISYGEGQMPLGLGAASGICAWGYCPQEGEGVEINPREVPTSPYAVRWDGFNWDSLDDDVNIFEPSGCLASHLAGNENSCCEQGIEPCDGWPSQRAAAQRERDARAASAALPPPKYASESPKYVDRPPAAAPAKPAGKLDPSFESFPGEWDLGVQHYVEDGFDVADGAYHVHGVEEQHRAGQGHDYHAITGGEVGEGSIHSYIVQSGEVVQSGGGATMVGGREGSGVSSSSSSQGGEYHYITGGDGLGGDGLGGEVQYEDHVITGGEGEEGSSDSHNVQSGEGVNGAKGSKGGGKMVGGGGGSGVSSSSSSQGGEYHYITGGDGLGGDGLGEEVQYEDHVITGGEGEDGSSDSHNVQSGGGVNGAKGSKGGGKMVGGGGGSGVSSSSSSQGGEYHYITTGGGDGTGAFVQYEDHEITGGEAGEGSSHS